MPDHVVRIPSPYGGVSRQPTHIRHPNQVEEGDNTRFTVVNGAEKRPGSDYVAVITGFTLAGDYRMHEIVRDADEQYVVIYGLVSNDMLIKVYDEVGANIPIVIDAASQAYLDLNNAGADDLRLVTIKDFTFILNTTVEAKTKTSDQIDIEATWQNYTEMVQQTPTALTYHTTRESGALHTRGFWYYDPGKGTYATIVPETSTGFDQLSAFKAAVRNPGGFRIFFGFFSGTETAVAFDGTDTLTKAGAWADYTWTDGDYVNVTSGTGITRGHYKILSATDDDLVIDTDIGAANADSVVEGIGRSYNVIFDFIESNPSNLIEVAQVVQDAMQAAGAANALCHYTALTSSTGKMTITSPYRGSGATFSNETDSAIIPPDATPSVMDWTGAYFPFNQIAGSVEVDGTGSPRATGDGSTVADRWTRVPPNNQDGAKLDETTMPVQMVRYDAGTETIIKASGPRNYWRLGEAATVTTADDEMDQGDGTHNAADIAGATSLLTGDSDLAAVYVIADTDLTSCGTLGSFGSESDDNGITLEAWIKTGNTANAMCVMGITDSSTGDEIELVVNSDDGASYVEGKIYVNIYDGANRADGKVDSDTGINDDVATHIMATFNPTDGTWEVYLNGVAQTVDAINSDTVNAMSDFTEEWAIGARGGATPALYFGGTIDEVAIYAKQLTAKDAERHYNAGAAQYFFDITQPTWGFRWTGDDDTNPVPSIWLNERKISDINFHRNRMVLGADENVVFSQADQFFDFYIEADTNVVDSDPIDITLPSNQVALIDYIVPFNRALLIFTQAGEQYELNAPETLTPSTATITLSTTYTTISVRPMLTNQFVYFAANQQDVGMVYEYFYDDTRVTNIAANVTAHVFNYLPTNLQTLAASTNNNTLFALPDDEDHLFVYTYFWTENRKEQSAWAKYQFDSSYTIKDVVVIGDDLFMLVDDGTQHILEKISISREVADTGWPWPIHLDRKVELTGSLNGSDTEWTVPFTDTTLDTVISGPDFTTPGTITTITVSGTTATATGVDLTAGECRLGRKYTMDVELTRPFVRDRNNHADFAARTSPSEISVGYRESGHVKILAEATNTTDITEEMDQSTTPGTLKSGSLNSFQLGSTEEGRVLSIQSDSPMPTIITAVEWVLGYETRD